MSGLAIGACMTPPPLIWLSLRECGRPCTTIALPPAAMHLLNINTGLFKIDYYGVQKISIDKPFNNLSSTKIYIHTIQQIFID